MTLNFVINYQKNPDEKKAWKWAVCLIHNLLLRDFKISIKTLENFSIFCRLPCTIRRYNHLYFWLKRSLLTRKETINQTSNMQFMWFFYHLVCCHTEWQGCAFTQAVGINTNTMTTKNLVSEKPILFFLGNPLWKYSSNFLMKWNLIFQSLDNTEIVELMSSQPPSVFTNVEDCSSDKHNLCCGCHMRTVIYFVASLLMLLCIIFWYSHWWSWDIELKSGTQRTVNSSLMPKLGDVLWVALHRSQLLPNSLRNYSNDWLLYDYYSHR